MAEVEYRPYWHGSLLHRAWTTCDGAPSAVFGVTQDQRGMLWFAAGDGVYRFDGMRYERLTAIDGNPLRSRNTNAVMSVGSALWVGYNFGGVSVFDQGKVRHYGVADGVPARTVHKFGHTPDGTMWVSTVDGLLWLDGQRWRPVTLADGLPAGRIIYFTDLPDGSLLVNHPGGIYRNTAGSHRFRLVRGSADLTMHQLLPDGRALLVDRERHFSRYAPLTDSVTPLPFPPGVQPVDLFQDRRGGLWINAEAGLTLLGPDLRPLHVFSGLNNLSGKQIFATLDDREGNLWLTTENGVDRIRESRLTTIDLPARMWRALTVQSDREGSVWFANAQTLWHGDAGRWQSWPLPAGLRGNEVQALAEDSGGRLWVSVVHSGVHVFQHGTWQAGGGVAALARRTAVSLLAEPQGKVWFGYPDSRLAVLDRDGLREYGPADGLAVGNVTVMASHGGRLWVGGDEGVAALEGRRFAALVDADGQSLNGVAGMVLTAAGELWLHGGDGLIRITAAQLAAGKRVATDRFNHLDGYDGKPPQIRPLSVLTEAPDGRVWYATASSVGWVDPARIPHDGRAPLAYVTALRTERRQYDARPGLVLPQRTRNLDIEYTAGILGIPERVRFRYRLADLEDVWHEGGTRRAVSYTNLGPGDYRFEVLATNQDGVWSVNPATLAFSIAPTFVQTIWFKLLCGALLLALAALLYWRRMVMVTARITERLRERLRERERIARTLHDNFLQSVQALMMQFDVIKHGLPREHPLQAKIDVALDTADEVLCEGREQVLALRINHELNGDLDAALSGLGHILAPRHGVRFTLMESGERRPLRAAAAAEAYAIGREALLNALRHAQCPEVTVELRYARAGFSLQVRDTGRGMQADVRERGHRPGHFGLTGMRERARDAGGTLEIRSESGKGTAITLRLPARRAYSGALTPK